MYFVFRITEYIPSFTLLFRVIQRDITQLESSVYDSLQELMRVKGARREGHVRAGREGRDVSTILRDSREQGKVLMARQGRQATLC